jgi:hypothetical protein
MVATKPLAFVMPCSLWPDPRNTYQQEWNVASRTFRLAIAVVTLAESREPLAPIRKSDLQKDIDSFGGSRHGPHTKYCAD